MRTRRDMESDLLQVHAHDLALAVRHANALLSLSIFRFRKELCGRKRCSWYRLASSNSSVSTVAVPALRNAAGWRRRLHAGSIAGSANPSCFWSVEAGDRLYLIRPFSPNASRVKETTAAFAGSLIALWTMFNVARIFKCRQPMIRSQSFNIRRLSQIYLRTLK